MDRLLVQGGVPLGGEIAVSGSKNSALPALAACLLTKEPVTLERITRVRDIRTMLKLLAHTGVRIDGAESGPMRLVSEEITEAEAPYEVVKTMRASSLVLGPLVARAGRARVSLPGGCAIGARPINLHIRGLQQLGATIRQERGYIEAEAVSGRGGGQIHFDRSTVTGTEDLLMAATLADGETV
ncbi:MAG: UDP-N-acetylglucosamine 1-carboxyvinyltransferase, partial [bacterium]|nr:UDP-N-acetylglucosamine 1-carboxyvinyltransferase [bacterium]